MTVRVNPIVRSKRERLAEEAGLLRAIHRDQPDSWYVGRTDMQSYNSDGVPEHYAYGPGVLRVRFLGDDGDEALETSRREKPDLLTLDLGMPGRDVGEVFEALRKDPELGGLKICVITGRPELRKLIYDRSVRPPEGYLDKPVTEEVLLRGVRKVLELAHEG